MARIIIRNVAQLKALNKKLRIVSAILPTLQNKALENAAHDTVLNDIHKDMRVNQFSEKIINATFVGPIELQNVKRAKIHFISDYVDPKTDFDVSEGREEGTASGITRRPKKPDSVLRWIAKTGEIIFRKSSTPKGIERLLIVEKNINKNRQTFKDSYDNEIVTKILQVLT